jgi:hypothetical protein
VEAASLGATPAAVLIVAAAVAEAVVVGAWAMLRGINADEGFYLAAGRHAAQGLRIYADFFFPQMPYLPWLEGLLFRWVTPSLDAGRALSVVASTMSAGVLTALAWRESRSTVTTLLVAFLYVASALMISSQSVLKTAAVSNLLVLLAFACVTVAGSRGLSWALLGGIAAGCAIGVRLPIAPVTLVLAALAWRHGWPALIAYAAGGILASLPWLVVALRSPDEFWFCNFGFHSLRREISGWGPILAQKAGIFAKWLLLPQHIIVWALAFYGLWRAPRRVWPAALCVAVLAAAYAAATPTYLEYMSQFFPFLLLAGVPALEVVSLRRFVLLAVAAIYLAGLYPLLRAPDGGSATAAERSLWSRATVAGVSSAVRDGTGPGDLVLSWWEGYPVLSERPGVRGVGFWESNAARKLDPEQTRRFHVVRRDEILDLIRRREPAAIVVADGVWEPMRAEIAAGYDAARRVDAVQVYRRR